MKTTRVYITGTPDMHRHVERAQKIANQKGCEPVEVLWPKVMPSDKNSTARADYDNEVKVCQKQFHELISECDLFFAIVGNQYSTVQVTTGDSLTSKDFISPDHYELFHALARRNGLGKQIFARLNEPSPGTRRMIGEVPENLIDTFETLRQFEEKFSRKLTEYLQDTLDKHLERLNRFSITVICKEDRPGLLQGLAETVNRLEGNLAGGSHITKGNAILQFVAEWPQERCPSQESIETELAGAFRELIKPERKKPGEPRDRFTVNVTRLERDSYRGKGFRTLLTFVITFIDQPGIADHIFTVTAAHRASVLLTEVDTFVSGGIMLGRIRFRVRGDKFGPDGQKALERGIRKLPGILHVDSTALRGRFWE